MFNERLTICSMIAPEVHMRILAINASYRGDRGYTRFLIDHLIEGASEAGAECEVISLAKLKIHHCLACFECQKTALPEGDGYLTRCVYDDKDDAAMVFKKIACADLIIYATPVYIFTMSGLLKILLERLNGRGNSDDLLLTESGLIFHWVDHRLCSKPFAVLVCCDNLENESPRNVIEYFKTFSRFMDAQMVGALVRNGGKLVGYGQDSEAARRFPKIEQVYAAYRKAGGELATLRRITPATLRQANQEIIPAPLFGLLKRLPFRPVKRTMVTKARELTRLPDRP
jgi:multimeric flavodoxin WrbA